MTTISILHRIRQAVADTLLITYAAAAAKYPKIINDGSLSNWLQVFSTSPKDIPPKFISWIETQLKIYDRLDVNPGISDGVVIPGPSNDATLLNSDCANLRQYFRTRAEFSMCFFLRLLV